MTLPINDGGLVIRRMRDEDSEYELMVEWRNRPHVRRRWDADDPPMTLSSAKQEYQPDTVPGAPGTAYIVELDERPIGFIQFYRWASFAEEADTVGIPFDECAYGIDVFIGEPDLVGQGLGTRIVTMLSDHLINRLGASSVALTVDKDNLQAIRSYEKAGFVKIKEVLDIDTYQGERIRSWLMVKASAS